MTVAVYSCWCSHGYGDWRWDRCNSSSRSKLHARNPLDMGTDVGIGITRIVALYLVLGFPKIYMYLCWGMYFLMVFPWVWGLMLG